jgi:hypothetical protein
MGAALATAIHILASPGARVDSAARSKASDETAPTAIGKCARLVRSGVFVWTVLRVVERGGSCAPIL